MKAGGLNLSLAVLCGLGIVAACLLGSTVLPVGSVVSALFGGGEVHERLIVWEVRLPRALAALLTGMALGLSGAALQGLLRNPLAEPGVLGVSASAALGATLSIALGFAAFGPLVLPVFAVLGALGATALLALAAMRTRSMVTLILVGVGLASFAGAVMALMLNMASNLFMLSDLVNWTLGSVANRSLDDLAFSVPFITVGAAVLWGSRRGLTALTLGEEAAQGVGLNLLHQRLLVILGTGLATGGAVALAGAIGFVGIVAPHIVRPWVKHDPAATLLPSALLGGFILLLADIAVRLIPSQNELQLGVLAALIGAPAFVWIAMQRRTGHD